MTWVTSLVTASKERQTGAKSCKAGKLPLHLTRRGRRRRSGPRSRSGKGSHTFKAVVAMMRELMTHGTTIVGTIGLAAPMSMLTICAADNLCGEGSFYNDCPIEIQSLDSAWGARHGLHPDLLRRVAWPGSGRIFPLRDEAIAVEARSFAREHAWLGGIDFGYDHPFDELIYLPAAE
jgi:hypothetical protein